MFFLQIWIRLFVDIYFIHKIRQLHFFKEVVPKTTILFKTKPSILKRTLPSGKVDSLPGGSGQCVEGWGCVGRGRSGAGPACKGLAAPRSCVAVARVQQLVFESVRRVTLPLHQHDPRGAAFLSWVRR